MSEIDIITDNAYAMTDSKSEKLNAHRSNSKHKKGIIANWLAELARLIWALNCAGCNAQDIGICDNCITLIQREHYPITTEQDDMLAVSRTIYQGAARNIILKFKDHKRLDLEPFIAVEMHKLTEKLIAQDSDIFDVYEKIAIVPAPSSRKNISKRGHWPTQKLSASVYDTVKNAFPNKEVRHIALLKNSAKAKKQVKIQGADREANKKGNVQLAKLKYNQYKKFLNASTNNAEHSNVLFIIVDDIFTSGATIKGCKTVLDTLGNAAFAITFAKTESTEKKEK
jgi:predicted amidophosphoribosyltransferase